MTKQAAQTSTPTLTELPGNRVVRLDNRSCPYCGKTLIKNITDKEHVIGRRFVPKGKLEGQWNLILNACTNCNNIKSELEDDISAITMQPDALGRFGHEDATGKSEAARKAKNSYSRRTRKRVKESREQIEARLPLGPGIKCSIQFVGPPQVDDNRVFQLAYMQLLGFFYWLMYQDDKRLGYCWPGGFHPIQLTNRSDWGNPVNRAFADAVRDWEPRVRGVNADEFYKIAIRKHPRAACWSWALEWNQALRITGLCGDPKTAQDFIASLPKHTGEVISKESNATISYRKETPLSQNEDDNLFG